MRRLLPTLGVICALVALPGCGNEVELKEFSPPGRGFKVMMPANPKEQTQNAAGTTFTMWGTESRSGGYMVGVADMPIPPNEPADKIQERLEGGVQGAVNNIRGTLVNKESIMLDGKHPGRALEAKFDKGMLRGRFYLVGTRMYQLLVVGSSGYVNSDSANKFLQSLSLTQ